MGLSYANVYYQDATPTPEHIGDLWITDLGVIKVCYRTTLRGGANLWQSPTAFDITAQALTSGQIFAGSGSNLAAAVAISGDATLSSLGALSVLNRTIQVRNESGSTIVADKLVALVNLDTATGLPLIVLADADVAAHDDVWVTTASITTAATGTVRKLATSAATLNTNSASATGDPVYLSTTAGGFAHTAPTTAISRNQPVGFVLVKSATVGQILWHIGPVRMIGTNELQLLAVDTGQLAANAVTAAKITAAILVGTQVAVVANGNVVGGIPVMHRVTCTNLTGDVDVTLTHKTRIVDVHCIGTATGGAADTVTVKNGATAITNAIDMNVADQTVVRVGTIDDAAYEIAAAGTLRVSGASAVNAEVVITGLRVA